MMMICLTSPIKKKLMMKKDILNNKTAIMIKKEGKKEKNTKTQNIEELMKICKILMTILVKKNLSNLFKIWKDN